MKKRKMHTKNVWRVAVHTWFVDNDIKSVLVVNFSTAGEEYVAELELQQGYTEDSIKKLLKLHGFD